MTQHEAGGAVTSEKSGPDEKLHLELGGRRESSAPDTKTPSEDTTQILL